MTTNEESWEDVYTKVEAEKELERDLINERIKKADEFNFEEIQFSLNNNGEDKSYEESQIPPGFVMAGLRFRSKNLMKREECKHLVKSIVNDIAQTDKEFKEGLEQADILEEVSKGKIRAFCILADPIVSKTIGNVAKDIYACSLIIMSE